MTKATRSLIASEIGIERARKALIDLGMTQTTLDARLDISRSTISSFFNRKPIDKLKFAEICKTLKLEWEEIVEKGNSMQLDNCQIENTTVIETNPPHLAAFVIKGYFPVDDLKLAEIQVLVKQLQRITSDASLEIVDIQEGSIKIILKGTPEALTIIQELYNSIQLSKSANFLKVNLSGADLFEANLGGVNLSGIDLSGANLIRADLSGANLMRADLSGASLSEANLSGANLMRTDLNGANLMRADLSGANLSRSSTRLIGANLSGANLSRARLSEADLLEVNLSSSDLIEANLSGANLSGANLSLANLFRADLFGTNLNCSDLSEANLSEANLSGADLIYANVKGARFINNRGISESLKLDLIRAC
jgi:uncharacterized protein YjbI with pentapeptide repeats/DNA-binding Xre family transcriptional regulator